MFIINRQEWIERLQKAYDNACISNQPVIVSEVFRIDDGDPFVFYSNSESKYRGQRFFWRDPNRKLILSAVGTAYPLLFSGKDNRYVIIEDKWNELLKRSIIYGEKTEGTGPLLLGAFSFDPKKKKTKLWQHYHDVHFYIPKFVFTQNDEGSFVTLTMIVTPHTQPDTSVIPDEKEIFAWFTKDSQSESTKKNHVIAKKSLFSEEWMDIARLAIRRIREGKLEKVVLAREVRALFQNQIQVVDVLKELCEREIYSYIFALESDTDCFLGATPERLIRRNGNVLYSTCLAGSIRRGQTDDEDMQLGSTLLNDMKNRKEHQIVVDMIRKALEPYCMDVTIPSEPQLLKLKHIQHLYTPVTGLVKEGTSLLRLVEKLHPTPALGGSPRESAIELIKEIEPMDRGLYGAPIGWMDAFNNGEFAVAIRSALIQGSEASLFAGCGIVSDSVPKDEFHETEIKLKPMLTALGGELYE